MKFGGEKDPLKLFGLTTFSISLPRLFVSFDENRKSIAIKFGKKNSLLLTEEIIEPFESKS